MDLVPVGEAHEPAGEYADLLALICDTNGFAFNIDLLTTLHDGLWEVMRQDDTTAWDAALAMFQRAMHAVRQPQEPEGHSEALEVSEKARIHLTEAVARKRAEEEAVRRFRGSWTRVAPSRDAPLPSRLRGEYREF